MKTFEDYKSIAAWGNMMESFPAYILNEQRLALKEKAPIDAIYKREDGSWATLKDLKSKDTMRAMLKELQKL